MQRVLLLIGALVLPAATWADTYSIDPAHTYPNFTINHLGFSTLHGRFGKTSGTITMDQAKGTGSVDIVIDTASIDTGFAKRDDHLRSPDFFNAAEFPEITFKSTKVAFSGKGATVTGDLTMKGVTKSVTLNVDSINCGVHPFNKKQVCGFNATGQVKRSDFGIKYALPAVGDEVNLTLEVEAVKK
jgi:polyisoprenoid-binding protein YceI